MKINKVKYKDIEQIPRIQIRKELKGDFFGSSPAPFIGRYGYPKVNVGVLSPQFSGNTSYYNSPKLWSKANFAIGQVASLRYGLVNSRTQANIKSAMKPSKFLSIAKEVGMSKKSVELEINLKNKPSLNFKPEKEIIPFGPRAEVRKARITENSKVDTRVERVVSDTDLKSVNAILSLYKKGFEEASLNKLLSVGNLGIGKNRKLVPTRWSITAVDDTVGKNLIKEVKDLNCGDYQVYFGGGWGNYYLLLFFPDVWSYELFETYLNKDINPWSKNRYAYSTDYESYAGRKDYAHETAGGYYAARLGVLENMKQRKRQGSCLALRFITKEYNVPLGVWVCREACRKSTLEKTLTFASEKLMLQYTKELIQRKFGFDFDLLINESKLLKHRRLQSKLTDF